MFLSLMDPNLHSVCLTKRNRKSIARKLTTKVVKFDEKCILICFLIDCQLKKLICGTC